MALSWTPKELQVSLICLDVLQLLKSHVQYVARFMRMVESTELKSFLQLEDAEMIFTHAAILAYIRDVCQFFKNMGSPYPKLECLLKVQPGPGSRPFLKLFSSPTQMNPEHLTGIAVENLKKYADRGRFCKHGGNIIASIQALERVEPLGSGFNGLNYTPDCITSLVMTKPIFNELVMAMTSSDFLSTDDIVLHQARCRDTEDLYELSVRRAILSYKPQMDLGTHFSTQWRNLGARRVEAAPAGASRGARNSTRRKSPARGPTGENGDKGERQKSVELVPTPRVSSDKGYAPPSPKRYRGPEGAGKVRDGGRETGKPRGTAPDDDSLRHRVRTLLSRTEVQGNVLAKQAISIGDTTVTLSEINSRLEEQGMAMRQIQTMLRGMEYRLQVLLTEKTANLNSREYVPPETEKPALSTEDEETLSIGNGESQREREELLRDNWDA